MRPAIAHRHAEALCRTNGNVGAEIAGRSDQRQRQRIGGNDGDAAFCLQRRDGRARIIQPAMCAGILEQRAEDVGLVEIARGVADDQRPAEWFGAGAQHRQRLRMHLVIDKEGFRFH